MSYPAALPFILAAGELILIWFVLGLLATEFNPLKWAYGQDGRVSTSKLQLLLWMAVVLYSFLTILAVAVRRGTGDLIPNVPPNVLIALGFTGVTTVAAKGITLSQLQKQSITKIPPSAQSAHGRVQTASGLFGAVQEDDGTADLGKIQMSAWTLIALGIYLFRLVESVRTSMSGVPALPDIDPSLMVLTGLSQGTYLGKKLVTTSTPQLFNVKPPKASPGDLVAVNGAAFGDHQNGNLLLLGGFAIQPDDWSDTRIPFTVPDSVPNADPANPVAWKVDQKIQIQVISSGRDSVGDVDLTVQAKPPPGGPPGEAAVTEEPQPVTTGPNGGKR